MNSALILAIVVGLTTVFGIWHKLSRGRITAKKASDKPVLSAKELGHPLGSRATFVQFSSAFCSPCRATKALLSDVTADLHDVVHIDIDAESNLELVRRLSINSTPTTIILNRDGMEVGRAVGAPKRDQVVAALAAIL